jgi:hypothetical protein
MKAEIQCSNHVLFLKLTLYTVIGRNRSRSTIFSKKRRQRIEQLPIRAHIIIGEYSIVLSQFVRV